MTHRIYWRVPNVVLCLELEGNLSPDDFAQINQAIVEHLGPETQTQTVTLLVDITRPGTTPSAFAQLKASQTYTMRRDLNYILVVGRDKFMRLMMLLTFNLCKPSLKFFDDMDQALAFASARGAVSSK
jgi:hypothetical protein